MIIDYNDCTEETESLNKSRFQKAAEIVLAQEIYNGRNEEQCAKASKLPLYISMTIVNRKEIQEINNTYRGIDRVTDVLSFPQYENKKDLIEEIAGDEAEVMLPLGDVVICIDKAKEQSKEYGTTFEREVTYLFVHSMLHLLGYDHIKESDRHEMRKREESVMKTLGLERK